MPPLAMGRLRASRCYLRPFKLYRSVGRLVDWSIGRMGDKLRQLTDFFLRTQTSQPWAIKPIGN